jgi:putative PIN family toxin of toxin-antitoxin system
MSNAILDTNVIVQSLIGSSRAASSRVLDAYFAKRFELIYSPASLDELLNVLLIPKIRRRHGLSDDEVLDFIASLIPFGRPFSGTWHVSHSLARDVTDTKLLALAEESAANYLVTNDHRHLLPIGMYHHTRILTPAQFLHELS